MKLASEVLTLADAGVLFLRCCGCFELLPLSANVEHFETNASQWIVVECPKCRRSTPHQLALEEQSR